MKNYPFEIVFEKDRNGYFVYCPALQGCYTEGKTYEEALKNIKDVIRIHLADRRKTRQPIPSPEAIGVTTLELSV